MKDVNARLTEIEKNTAAKFRAFLSGSQTLMKAISYTDRKINKDYYQPKNNGQYGYYMSNPEYLPIIFDRLGIDSILDLGSGPGLLLNALWHYDPGRGMNVKGFEIEDHYVELGQYLLGENKIVKKDILTIKKKDILPYKVLYFWRPFCDYDLQRQFESNLLKIAQPGQFIFSFCGDVSYHDRKLRDKKAERIWCRLFCGSVYKIRD